MLDEFPAVPTAVWEDAIRVELKGGDPARLVWRSEDGLTVKPFYRREDAAGLNGVAVPPQDWAICEGPEAGRAVVDAGRFLEQGGSTVQELAFTLAESIARLTAGPDVELGFSFAIGPDYFFEIAKLWAFRLLYAQVRRAFGLAEGHAYIHARTSMWNMSIYDSHVNVLRGTTEAMSAVLGGADAVTVAAFDAAYREPSEASRRLAVNTQLVLKHEARLAEGAGAAAGSYYIEVLIDSLAQAAWKMMQQIEAEGGFDEGRVAVALAKSRAAKEAAVASGARVFVGVNRYVDSSEKMRGRVERFVTGRGPGAIEESRLAGEGSSAGAPGADRGSAPHVA